MEQYSSSKKNPQMIADMLKNNGYRIHVSSAYLSDLWLPTSILAATSEHARQAFQENLPRGDGRVKIINLAAVTVQSNLRLLFVSVRHITKVEI